MTFIRAHKVSKTYYEKKRVFKDALRSVTLDIHEGEVLGLLGVNGAGKTTLVSVLSTLHPPTGGDVEWNGVSVYTNLLEYRKNIGLCPQHPNLEANLSLGKMLVFSGRCYGLSKDEAEERKQELLEQFNLEEYANASVDQVSGGYRQRFLIARAHAPP